MPSDIVVDEKSEFFITIVKEGIHSFIMLGVVVDGKPLPLARVGKGNLIDKSFGTGLGSQLTMFKKVVTSGTDASLMDEGVDTDESFVSDVSYQAYAITFKQYLDFLVITREIQQAQRQYYQDRIQNDSGEVYSNLSYPEKGVRKLILGIKCYVPIQQDEGKITFQYKPIDTFACSAHGEQAVRKGIIQDASVLHSSNTCRTTARSLLNYTLNSSPHVPALFAVGLAYQTKLVGSKPTATSFYILPPPPLAFTVSSSQMKTLKMLYKKLENLPKTEPTSPITKGKFDELKKLYQQIAGESNLSLTVLLDKITVHRAMHNELFDVHRGQGLVSRFLATMGAKTGTQKAYDRMEEAIRKEMERVKVVGANEQNNDRCPPRVGIGNLFNP